MALSLGLVLLLVSMCLFRDAAAGCPMARSSEIYAYYTRMRMQIWGNETLGTARPWQHLVNNKLAGYMYAMHHGVPTPKVYSCNRGIPKLYPELWGTNSFIVKPLNGWNSVGVVVSDDGYDKSTSLPMTNETLREIYHLRENQLTNKVERQMVAPDAEFMVEEYLRPLGDFHNNGMPADFKFEVFDGKILLIRYIERVWGNQSKPKSHCVSIFDANWNILNDVVIFGSSQCSQERSAHPPKDFEAMKDMVLRMANGLGVYYRIDMFFTSRGPVLGEFTPWTSGGIYHDSKTCYLVSAWGGDSNPRSVQLARAAKQPDVLKGWGELSTMQKCKRVQKMQQSINEKHTDVTPKKKNRKFLWWSS